MTTRAHVAVAVALIALIVAPAAAAEQRTLSLLSDGPFGVDANVDPTFIGASDDGSRAFFETTEILATTDTDAVGDVYSRAGGGALIHLTDDPTGTDEDFTASLAGWSSDGTRAYFHTSESLAATDTDLTSDVYERTATGALIHISDDPVGNDGNIPARFLGASSDGTRVYFRTRERLVPVSDADETEDIYELTPGGLRHLTDDPTGADADLDALFRRASPDGAHVYFLTDESLAGTDTDTAQDVYDRTAAGALIHVSDDPTGPDADAAAVFNRASDDGSRVWFSTSESLAASDTDTNRDVYERAPTGALTHVTRDPTGVESGIDASFAGAPADGSRVFFTTAETMAATDTDSAIDVYERRSSGELIHVSHRATGADENVDAGLQDISADGRHAFFGTPERLTASDTDGTLDVYERTAVGALIHLSDDPTGTDDEADALTERTSDDGLRVVFTTTERLTAADTDTAYDAYERGPDGALVNLSGGDDNTGAFVVGASRDATRVFFGTLESLAAADIDTAVDIYASALAPDAAGPPAGGPGPSGDTTAPRLSRLRLVPARFAPGTRLPRLVSGRARRTGAEIRFTLSERARVRIGFKRGRRAVRGSFTVSGRAGANRVRFHGRLSATRRLAPGRYFAIVTATDRAGNRSAARRAAFTIVRR